MVRGHYLLIVLPNGKDHVRREYVPLERINETEAEVLDRYVRDHRDMRNRQRNRDKTEAKLRGEILYTRMCRPSSWLRAQKESAS